MYMYIHVHVHNAHLVHHCVVCIYMYDVHVGHSAASDTLPEAPSPTPAAGATTDPVTDVFVENMTTEDTVSRL